MKQTCALCKVYMYTYVDSVWCYAIMHTSLNEIDDHD